MVGLLNNWQNNDDYSAGLIVPVIAVFLVWRDRRTLRQCPFVPCWWGGIAFLMLAETIRVYGLLSMRHIVGRYSLVFIIAGLVLTGAGWRAFRRVLWILGFLFLMIPLPVRVHNLISEPLQRLATTASVFLLQVISPDVSQEGNIVVLGENLRVAVTEACSGLRMLTAFIMVAAFVAYMVKRSRWQKAVLLAMSIPVAVICNVLRICLTGVLALYVSERLAEKFFHDFAGLVMMPAAVSLLFAGLRLTDRFVAGETGNQEKSVVVRAKSVRAAVPKRLPA
jgi:exosortase